MTNYLGMRDDEVCSCGKVHTVKIDDVIVGKGVISALPDAVKRYGGKKVFLIADINTYKVAGDTAKTLLIDAGISVSEFVFPDKELEPDERAVGAVFMHYDYSADVIVAVGSGVINDISKIVSKVADKPYIIVGTAPSMDGYASDSSSMARSGLKVSLPTKSPDIIIGDVDILKTAPDRMLQAGLGDMVAKYVSICEWNIANVINGEYYCEKVAGLIRNVLKRCVDNADGLLKREDSAIQAVFEGLVIGGCAMAYAGVSRPASGVEHYFSHIWDMRALEFGLKADLHGIQTAVGTLYAIKIYEKLKDIKPSRQKAEEFVDAFDFEKWAKELSAFMGSGADTMIAQEAKEHKYDKSTHGKRFDIIEKNWDKIVNYIDTEMPSSQQLETLLDKIKAPKYAKDIGVDEKLLPMTFKSTKDIRDKYVLPRLCWDLGILDEIAATL